jgi:hypothetical protein
MRLLDTPYSPFVPINRSVPGNTPQIPFHMSPPHRRDLPGVYGGEQYEAPPCQAPYLDDDLVAKLTALGFGWVTPNSSLGDILAEANPHQFDGCVTGSHCFSDT